MGMIMPGHTMRSNCRTMYPRDMEYFPYCKIKNQKKGGDDEMYGRWMDDDNKIEFDEKSKTVLTKKEVEELWEITSKGIDLEDVVEIYKNVGEMMKPVFELYNKNVKTYLKFKEGK